MQASISSFGKTVLWTVLRERFIPPILPEEQDQTLTDKQPCGKKAGHRNFGSKALLEASSRIIVQSKDLPPMPFCPSLRAKATKSTGNSPNKTW